MYKRIVMLLSFKVVDYDILHLKVKYLLLPNSHSYNSECKRENLLLKYIECPYFVMLYHAMCTHSQYDVIISQNVPIHT